MPKSCYTSVARTEKGNVRATNQDAYLNDDVRQLWAVADGMGGHSGGEIASARLIEKLSGVPNPDAARLMAAVQAVNLELHEQSTRLGHPQKMGTTLALLWIKESRFCCLWAGDSRVYRLRGNKLERLTRDHRYVEELLELGLLNSADLENHPQRNVVTRAIGSELQLDLACARGIVDVNDSFLLVTDGVSNLCNDDEVCAALLASTPGEAVDSLLAICIARGAPDNLTAVLITVRQF